MLTVDTVVQFFPRGGSAQVIRYLGRELTGRGLTSRILCGSLGTSGDFSHAPTFYAGLDVAAMDYNAAAAAYAHGGSGMDGQSAPFHPSYEDRGPSAPDRMFTAVAPATNQHLISAWNEHLTGHRSPRPAVVHLHHLSHLQVAVRRAYPGIPVITTFHGTDLKLLDRAQQVTRFAERLGVSLSTLGDACHDNDLGRKRMVLERLLKDAGLTGEELAYVHTKDWRLWRYADLWSGQMRRYARCAGRIVVVSDSDRVEVNRLLGIPEDDITVVPNGVDTTRFVPQHLDDDQRLARLRRWLIDDPRGWAPGQEPGSIRYTASDLDRMVDASGALRPVLLWIGRFQQVKRLNVLLEAFTAILKTADPAPVLLLWGGYPGETEGEHPLTAARRLEIDDHVYFIGWRDHDELPDGLNCADLMVAPAVNESFGMVYIEAAACGTPPIATNTGGPASIITGCGSRADGWLVKPDNVTDLVETLSAALADPVERARRAANAARHTHRSYSWAAVADRYQRLCEEAAHGRRGGAP
ncbi:glycosyltransferase family 4 protein [Streptosporangium sp. NPDC000509]|uniref:glycosyltransferase family 4 protein n=1 Tax=Streptosporangium sp. NPDC000509 TaxID=3366186 RepID=UPI00369A6D41